MFCDTDLFRIAGLPGAADHAAPGWTGPGALL